LRFTDILIDIVPVRSIALPILFKAFSDDRIAWDEDCKTQAGKRKQQDNHGSEVPNDQAAELRAKPPFVTSSSFRDVFRSGTNQRHFMKVNKMLCDMERKIKIWEP
jgi:hypothetical protein